MIRTAVRPPFFSSPPHHHVLQLTGSSRALQQEGIRRRATRASQRLDSQGTANRVIDFFAAWIGKHDRGSGKEDCGAGGGFKERGGEESGGCEGEGRHASEA